MMGYVHAWVVELADTSDSKSDAEKRAGSNPASGTKKPAPHENNEIKKIFF